MLTQENVELRKELAFYKSGRNSSIHPIENIPEELPDGKHIYYRPGLLQTSGKKNITE